jgi:hypothetical protein
MLIRLQWPAIARSMKLLRPGAEPITTRIGGQFDVARADRAGSLAVTHPSAVRCWTQAERFAMTLIIRSISSRSSRMALPEGSQ